MGNQKMKLLNGDCGLFFRNKINRIPIDKFIIETIEKWIGKTYKMNYETRESENIIVHRKTTFCLTTIKKVKAEIDKEKKFALAVESNMNNRKSKIYLYIEDNNTINAILY